LDLASGEGDEFTGGIVGDVRLIAKHQDQSKMLNRLDWHRATTNGRQCLLHKLVGKGTPGSLRSRHHGLLAESGDPSLFPLYQNYGLTTTLFVKRTTKRFAEEIRCLQERNTETTTLIVKRTTKVEGGVANGSR
jgi:hypothetical protein